MSAWQIDALAALRADLPAAVAEPYGSVLDPDSLDSWSDLDVTVRVPSTLHIEAVLGTPIWAYQSAQDGDRHVVRAVFEDGRRIDLSISGAEVQLPDPPADNEVRFEAALAAVRFGRGSDLIGLHLVLGILRDALVLRMGAADEAEGTVHHRHATAQDPRAAEGLAVLDAPLGPATARAAYVHYAAVRAEIDPAYTPDGRGLEAVIARGDLRAT